MTVSDFVSLYRTAVKDLYDARARLKTYAERAPSILADAPDGPLPGRNSDVTKADVVNAVNAAGELETHLTNYTVNPNAPTNTNLTLQKML